MNRQTGQLAWYRFRTTFPRRKGDYLVLVVLIGVVGGLAMAAVAGARRTQSAYPRYLASTNPSQLTVIFGNPDPSSPGYYPSLIASLAQLPGVKHAEGVVGLNDAPLSPDGAVTPADLAGNFGPLALGWGSLGGEFFRQDKLHVVAGRMADPARADEAVVNEDVVKGSRLHVGSVVPLGFLTPTAFSAFGSAASPDGVPIDLRMEIHVVGIVEDSGEQVEDDADVGSSLNVYFTPALARQVLGCCAYTTGVFLQLDSNRSAPSVEAEIDQALPQGFPFGFSVTSQVEGKAERAIEPESIALAVFGGIAALAALLIAGQVIGRQMRLGGDDAMALRTLGADPAMTAADSLVGILGAVVLGAVLAAGIAVALSPLAPIGLVRPVYPTPGVALDWTVLGPGLAAFVVALSGVAMPLAVQSTPHRRGAARLRSGDRRSGVAEAAGNVGLPVPAVVGIRFALEPGSGSNTVPVRSAILGTSLALVVAVATVTFASSLGGLVSHPARYGWNWDDAIVNLGGNVIDQQVAAALLDADRDVASWSGYYDDLLPIDGQVVPVLGGTPNTAVQPPVLSGHRFDGANQIVLGPDTLAQLHKRVGDTVTVGSGSLAARLTIVGTATMPAVAFGGEEHTEMGSGALLSYQLIPASARMPYGISFTGPDGIFVRLRQGVSASRAYQRLQSITAALTQLNPGAPETLTSVLRPAEITNYRSVGKAPALLGSGLAVAAVVALAFTLLASVRRRNRDLALLKTLGFTRRQLTATVAWQATVSVGIGTLIGVPLGIVVGRSLWDLFARNINAVPHPSVSTLPIVFMAVGAILLANVVAAIPGRIAAATPTALVLREGRSAV